MSTTKTLVATTSAIAILAVSNAVYENQEARQAQTSLATATQEIATLRGREQVAEQRAIELEAKVRTLESAATAAKTASPSKAAGSGQLASVDVQMEMLLANPEYQELSLKSELAGLRFRYGPLYQKLGLSAQQIADFESALIEKQQLIHDARFSAMNQGMSLNDPSLAKVFESPLKAMKDKLTAILGEDGYTQYDAYKNTASARSTADNLASSLYYTDSPLTADQADKLTAIVAANTTKTSPDAKTALVQETIDWNKVAAQTAEILQTDQQATLSAMIERDRVRKELFAVQKKLTNKAISSGSATKSP